MELDQIYPQEVTIELVLLFIRLDSEENTQLRLDASELVPLLG